ncbi:MAG: hypothetical protein HYX69_11165 [Planctomycetia bacterium]|nr:hypothetical protein [Planctomycetia bacterium]
MNEKFAGQLAELAAWADRQGLTDEARVTRAWLPPRGPNQIALVCRPGPEGDATKPPASHAAAWEEKFAALRREQAAALFALAQDAAKSGHAGTAFLILPRVVREDPDHAEARAILGYEQVDGRWLTPFESHKAHDGQVWHERFGWLPADHVARYEAGERFYGGRWMSAEAEARVRSDPRRGWDIGTEHYQVHTDLGLEEGVRLAVRLEKLYDAWQQLFAGFCASEEQLARRFARQTAVRSEPRRHKVVYFKSRNEYVRALEKDEPKIGMTTGYYLAAKRAAYFFAGEDFDASNLYHEATHQLFSEIRPVARDIGRDANFWIIEGIACYMESLVEQGDWCLVGGNEAVRLQDARHRLVVDNYYVPLAELTTFGMQRLQHDPRIAMLYSEASGLTHFLMHDAGGRYRDALVEYLVAVYTGHDNRGTLARIIGKSDGELDTEYRKFIEGLE